MNLTESIHLANIAHAGQKDRAGLPYILHPLRVMLAIVKKYPKDEEAAIAAILHDVVEDTDWVSLEYLKNSGFTKRTVDLIDALSRRKQDGEKYVEFIDRLQQYGTTHDIAAIRIKTEDIADNMSRTDHLSESDQKKYTKALEVLNK